MCFDQVSGALHTKGGWKTQHLESRPNNLQTIMNNHNKKLTYTK